MARGKANAIRRGFRQSFSAYIGWLIERDADGGVVREDGPTGAPPAGPTGPVLYTAPSAGDPPKPKGKRRAK